MDHLLLFIQMLTQLSFPFLITTITLTADLHLMLQEPFNDD